MNPEKYSQVCYRTEQREEAILLRNIKNGKAGYSFGCTESGETVQVRLLDGTLDSWQRNECTEAGSRSW